MRETKTKKNYWPRNHPCMCVLCGEPFNGRSVSEKYCSSCGRFNTFSKRYGPTKTGLHRLIDDYLAGLVPIKKIIWDEVPENLNQDTKLPYTCGYCKMDLRPTTVGNFLCTFKNPNFFFTRCCSCSRAISNGRTEIYDKQHIESHIQKNNLETIICIKNLEDKTYYVDEKLEINCLLHNTFTEQSVRSFLKGETACKECQAEARDSRGIQAIKTFLETNNIEYITEETFEGLYGVGNGKLKADIYIPSMKVWLEFDGHFHFRINNRSKKEDLLRQILNDQIKNTYCKNEGIRLIRIPYWQEKRIPEFLEFLVTGEESILPTVHPHDSIYQDMPKKNAELRRKLLQQPPQK